MEITYTSKLLTKELGKGYRIISKVVGGMMNVSYLVEDKDFDKYIIYLPNGKANKTVDRVNEKKCQKIVSDLGLTSKNIYFDTRKGIKINEFIEGVSLNKYKGEIDYQKVADLFHLIHDSKNLSDNDYHPFDRLGIYENKALEYQKESNEYRYIRDFLSTNFKKLGKTEKVLCHNDAQKSNIILGNDGKYYIIDFEFMANNDPIYDVAAFGNDSIDEAEKLFKYYYLKPTKKQWQRFYLWRIFISLQWHVMAIIKHHQNEGNLTKINFLNVSKFFLRNAYDAKKRYEALTNNKQIK